MDLRRFSRATSLIAGIAIVSSAGTSLALEAKVFAIGDFVGTGSGGCGGNDISHWPDMVDEWYDEMGSFGHSKDGQYTNGNMVLTRFCDPDWNGSCQDDDFVDEADVAMIATHGSDSGDHWQGTLRWPSVGGNCRVDGGGSGDEMSLGDVDLEFVHLSSCQSARRRQPRRHPLRAHRPGRRRSRTPVGRLPRPHVDRRQLRRRLRGFRGRRPLGQHRVLVGDQSLPQQLAGLRRLRPVQLVGTCEDQCPIAYSIGATESSALTRLNNERYNNVYSDPTGHSYYAYLYYEGCNPVGETTFNP